MFKRNHENTLDEKQRAFKNHAERVGVASKRANCGRSVLRIGRNGMARARSTDDKRCADVQSGRSDDTAFVAKNC